ncbi:MAG: hypothetical protein KF861_17880 [Planctomycetaceae bacterium]|nr:hypothetical protein [Planctomycetaceae bacterium]
MLLMLLVVVVEAGARVAAQRRHWLRGLRADFLWEWAGEQQNVVGRQPEGNI